MIPDENSSSSEYYENIARNLSGLLRERILREEEMKSDESFAAEEKQQATE